MAWDPVGRIRFKIVAMVGRGDINFARNYSLVCAEIFGNAVRVWFLKRGGGRRRRRRGNSWKVCARIIFFSKREREEEEEEEVRILFSNILI